MTSDEACTLLRLARLTIAVESGPQRTSYCGLTGDGVNVNHHFDWVILIWMLALVSFTAVMYVGQWVSDRRHELVDRRKRKQGEAVRKRTP